MSSEARHRRHLVAGTTLACALALAACTVERTEGDPAVAGAASGADSGWVAVDGGRLWYEVAGSGAPVVLLHGGFGDRRMWDAQFATLAGRFRVVRYDHRGFGRSPAPDSAYSPVADVIALLDHLGVERAHLVGNSMGGALALDVALLHPERVARVVVAASGANGVPYDEAEVRETIEVFRTAETEGTARAAERWLAHPMVAVASADPTVAPRLRAMVTENQRMFRLAHWPDEPLDPSAFERLGALRVPVLFLVGDRDTPLVRRAAETSAARVPGARLHVLPGTDHLPQMEKPEEFDRVVVGFLLDG